MTTVPPMFAGALFAALAALWFIRRGRRGVIRDIPGPAASSWTFGHMLQLVVPFPASHGEYEFKWRKAYGEVYKTKGCFGDRLTVSDPIALQYILNSSDFYTSPAVLTNRHWMLGARSVITAKGSEHKRLRAALNPGFSAASVRTYQPIFERVAHGISQGLYESTEAAVDMSPLLSAATFDAISQVVFGCLIQDLDAEFVENNITVMAAAGTQSASQIIGEAVRGVLPAWLMHLAIYLPTKLFKARRKQLALALGEGRRIVREKMEGVLDPDADIFSMLIELSSRTSFTEEDLVAQTSLISLAGQETTANTLAFGLVELAKSESLQDKLRAEVQSFLAINRDGGFDYDKMPLLNAFIKEVLRMYPAIPHTDRITLKPTVIPLSEYITLNTGERINRIPVSAGQIVSIATASYHRIESRWGEDSDTFNPFRWLDGTVIQGDSVGPYANLLSFFGGPHVCLGWRFALLEMQVILCELLGKFSFSLPTDYSPRARMAITLQPIDASGKKCARLQVKIL